MTTNKKVMISLLVILLVVVVIGLAVTQPKSTGENFEHDDNLPTLYDLGASWCGPCKEIAPIVEALKVKYKGKVNVETYDIEKSEKGIELSQKYGVTFIPALVYVDKDGNVLSTSQGLKSQAQIESVMRELGWIS